MDTASKPPAPPMSAAPRFLPALYDILDFLSQIKDSDDDSKIWGRIADKLCVALDAEAATYYSYLPAKRQLLPRYSLGVAAQDLRGTAVDLRTGLCGWTALHREPLIVDDAYKDPRFLKEVDALTGFKTATVMALPLIDRLDLLGVLEIINKRGGTFSAEDLKFAQAACRAAVTALRAAWLEALVDRMAAKNASIIENLGGGFLAVDTKGCVMLCNPAARRILSLSPEMPLHLPVEEAIGHVPKITEILLETLAMRRTVARQEFKAVIGGRDRLLGYSTIIIQDPQGEMTGAGITFQDITDARKPS